MTNEQYYTMEEVTKMLKVAYPTVYRWIQDSKLPSVKADKQYRIKKDDFNKFIFIKDNKYNNEK